MDFIYYLLDKLRNPCKLEYYDFTYLDLDCTPARTHFINGLKSRVLKITILT